MKDKDLVNAIRRLKVETRSLACIGCGHGHNCGVSGCAIMREAADRIVNQSTHIAVLQMEIEKLRGRLMQYEDTELTPEEIDMDHEAAEQLRQPCRGYDLGRLVNLAEADKAGRVVVRPYKIDAAVYVLVKDEAIFYPETNGWYIGKETIGAITQDGFYLGDPEEGSFGPNDEIGKTVFLTCEEAEAALKAMQDETR